MKFNLWSEYRFRMLWYFMAFTFGCALYFGLPREPNIWFCLVLNFILLGVIFLRKNVWVKLLFFFVFGISVATIRTHFVQTEFMWNAKWNQQLSGTVVQSFPTHTGQMVVLDHVYLSKSRFVPKRVRLLFKQQEPKLNAGDELLGLVNLFPPEPHQAQRFFYQGLGAQGQLLQILTHKRGNPNRMDEIREEIIHRLRLSLTPDQWQIAVPLLVGEQGVVSKDIYALYRKAGIAHVLSVSGFHMMLLATFVFFLVRGLLALFPYLALRLPTKKIAAVVAFAVTGFYLVLSGLQVPAIRSFLMISLVFLGILTDRKVVSLYTLCLVAFGVLLVRPEWVTSVSFQLSFVAVMILVGVFEDISKRMPKSVFFRLVVTAIIANILVTLALAPFVAYHFNQFNPYGVVGNLLTSVLFSFFVMPLLFVSAILMPFHWESLVLKATGFTLDGVTFLAKMVASWPGSEIIVPSFCGWGLGIITFGIAILCVMKNRWRLLGLVFVMVGLLLGYYLPRPADLIVLNRGKIILARQENQFVAVKGNAEDWSARRFVQQRGQTDIPLQHTKLLYINSMRVALDARHCDGADLAILPKKNVECGAKQVFVPKDRAAYHIFVKYPLLIQNSSDNDQYRPWGLHFKKKGKKHEK